MSAALTIPDYQTTKWFHDRNYKVTETSFIKNNNLRASYQFLVIAGGDILVQKKAPKYKWHYRIGITIIVAAAVGNNISKR